MKVYKSSDLFLQLILLVLTGFAFIIEESKKFNPRIFILAFAFVQIISIIIHLAAGPQSWKKKGERKFHLIGTGFVIIALIVALMQDSSGRTGDKDDKYGMPGLGTLLLATISAILLALFYTVITYLEWKKLKKEV
jgi:phosphomannomutase